MPKENNKMQVDIDNLIKQNVNDLLSIKELYRKLKEVEEKITQIKYIDNTLAKKLKKEYENLKKIILDENVQIKITNDIEKINLELDNKVNKSYIETINSQLDNKANQIDLEVERKRINTFYKLTDGSTTGDAELIDGRIGADGVIHTNIGDNIRSVGRKANEITYTLTGNAEETILDYSINVTSNNKSLTITKELVPNTQYYFKFNEYSGQYLKNISIYLYRADNTYSGIYNFTGKSNYVIDEESTFTLTENFTKIRFNVNVSNNTDSGVLSFVFGEIKEEKQGLIKQVDVLENRVKILESDESSFSTNFLIFGDSYSAQKRWIKSMQNFLNINDSNIVNLGVSGARLRDSYADRVAYPYSNKPKLGGSGNNNILASQIEKLKRLMQGTDLESGETQIYKTESDYPDIILIELGKNDYSDSETKYNNYLYEIFRKIENVYVSEKGKTPTQRKFYTPVPIEELDRTCFVGALAYAYNELHRIFPKALIFFIANSNLWNLTTEPDRDYKKHYQIKKACELMSIPLIDWYAESLVPNFLANYTGDGTEENPYILNGPSEMTLDELHPNEKGGELLGLKTATYIEPYLKFINKLQYQ